MAGAQEISGAQIRSGRALLALSSRELANLAQVSWATVKRFEEGDEIPPSRRGTLNKVKDALEAAGIEFIGDPVHSPGVRLRRR